MKSNTMYRIYSYFEDQIVKDFELKPYGIKYSGPVPSLPKVKKWRIYGFSQVFNSYLDAEHFLKTNYLKNEITLYEYDRFGKRTQMPSEVKYRVEFYKPYVNGKETTDYYKKIFDVETGNYVQDFNSPSKSAFGPYIWFKTLTEAEDYIKKYLSDNYDTVYVNQDGSYFRKDRLAGRHTVPYIPQEM